MKIRVPPRITEVLGTMADKSMSGSPHFRSHFVSGSEIDWELATGEYTCKTKYIYIYK